VHDDGVRPLFLRASALHLRCVLSADQARYSPPGLHLPKVRFSHEAARVDSGMGPDGDACHSTVWCILHRTLVVSCCNLHNSLFSSLGGSYSSLGTSFWFLGSCVFVVEYFCSRVSAPARVFCSVVFLGDPPPPTRPGSLLMMDLVVLHYRGGVLPRENAPVLGSGSLSWGEKEMVKPTQCIEH
jgi:hypothetical protein